MQEMLSDTLDETLVDEEELTDADTMVEQLLDEIGLRRTTDLPTPPSDSARRHPPYSDDGRGGTTGLPAAPTHR